MAFWSTPAAVTVLRQNIPLPHHAPTDTRVDQREQDVRHEIEGHDAGRQKKDDRPCKLLVVRPREAFKKKRPCLGQRQDQSDDRQFVEDPVEVEAKRVDDRAERVLGRIALEQLRA